MKNASKQLKFQSSLLKSTLCLALTLNLVSPTRSLAQEVTDVELNNPHSAIYLIGESDRAIRLQKLRFITGEDYMTQQLGKEIASEQARIKSVLDWNFGKMIGGAIAGIGAAALFFGSFSNCEDAVKMRVGALAFALASGFLFSNLESSAISDHYAGLSFRTTDELAYVMGWTSWDGKTVRSPKAMKALRDHLYLIQERAIRQIAKGQGFIPDIIAEHTESGARRKVGLIEAIKKKIVQEPILFFELEKNLKKSGIYKEFEARISFEGIRRVKSLASRLSDSLDFVERSNVSKRGLKKGINDFAEYIEEVEEKVNEDFKEDLIDEASKLRIEAHIERSKEDLRALASYYGVKVKIK